MGLPGVKVGPLDPDVTESFGQVSQSANARTLIRLHSQMHPPALIRALALKRDDERTKALYDAGIEHGGEPLEELREYVNGLRLESGDPVLPDGARVTGAAVRGERDRPQVVTFSYEVESGRSGKWFAPYDRDALPRSAELGDELVKIKTLKDRGIVEFDREGAGRYFDQREMSRLRRENAALRAQAEAQGDGEDVDLGPAGDTRPDLVVVDENEQLRRQNQELLERVSQLEAFAEQAAQRGITPQQPDDPRGPAPDPDSVASQEPPFEGYDDVNASELVKRIRDEETSDDEVRSIAEYERTHQNRKTVVSAIEERLGRTG